MRSQIKLHYLLKQTHKRSRLRCNIVVLSSLQPVNKLQAFLESWEAVCKLEIAYAWKRAGTRFCYKRGHLLIYCPRSILPATFTFFVNVLLSRPAINVLLHFRSLCIVCDRTRRSEGRSMTLWDRFGLGTVHRSACLQAPSHPVLANSTLSLNTNLFRGRVVAGEWPMWSSVKNKQTHDDNRQISPMRYGVHELIVMRFNWSRRPLKKKHWLLQCYRNK